MPEKNVVSVLQQMGRKRMTERVARRRPESWLSLWMAQSTVSPGREMRLHVAAQYSVDFASDNLFAFEAIRADQRPGGS